MGSASGRSTKVSIHAPAKGATPWHQLPGKGDNSFNPRSREGSDTHALILKYHNQGFNPRSREGSDSIAGHQRGADEGFNPRSREGSDTAKSIQIQVIICFNPRSREGSDRPAESIHSYRQVSIHAPAKGATNKVINKYAVMVFQSTLPRRERLLKVLF